jgi:hypothetical protein
MVKDRQLTATFFNRECTLVLDVEGDGSVDPPEGVHVYDCGEEVTLTVLPDTGWEFDEWAGDDGSEVAYDAQDDTWTIALDTDKEITAQFVEAEYDVDATTVGQGRVANTPGNPYRYGEVATLQPIPDPGWFFDDWSGPDASGLSDNLDGTWSLRMDGDKMVTATFTEGYRVTITTNGQGTVQNEPGNPYSPGGIATLRPAPASGWTFSEWGGPDASQLSDNLNGTWSLRMDSDKQVEASFVPRVFLPLVMR